jgi:hypothetical protein
LNDINGPAVAPGYLSVHVPWIHLQYVPMYLGMIDDCFEFFARKRGAFL